MKNNRVSSMPLLLPPICAHSRTPCQIHQKYCPPQSQQASPLPFKSCQNHLSNQRPRHQPQSLDSDGLPTTSASTPTFQKMGLPCSSTSKPQASPATLTPSPSPEPMAPRLSPTSTAKIPPQETTSSSPGSPQPIDTSKRPKPNSLFCLMTEWGFALKGKSASFPNDASSPLSFHRSY